MVPLTATNDGAAVLTHYPALVAGPVPLPAHDLDAGALPALANTQAVAMLERALRNYIGGSCQNLAADLAAGAMVDAAEPGLTLRSIQRLAIEPSGAVLATVLAADAGGTEFTLAYTVDLAQFGGRWEITELQP